MPPQTARDRPGRILAHRQRVSGAPSSPPRAQPGAGDRLIAATLAVVAAVWHALLMTRATNDNFLHLTFAQQWLAGDWPVRDFFDQGWVLQYALSAGADRLLGHRLGAEAVIVGLAWAISTYLVFLTVRRLTGSTVIAFASAVLLIVTGARGYSYPKGIVYAVAAALWWRYVHQPALRTAMVFGLWVAVAFYWRPDHGLYAAFAFALAAVAAHGLRPPAFIHSFAGAAVTMACFAPFLAYVQLVYGLPQYVRTGLVAAQVEHESHGTHEWPLLRYAGSIVTFDAAERYAPIVAIRWRPDSSAAARQDVRSRYGLRTVDVDDDGVERARLLATEPARIRALVNESSIDDTGGIDRSSGTLSPSTWPPGQQWRFRYRVLRLQLLPMLDPQARATELVAAAFFVFPLLTLLCAPWLARRLSVPGPRALAAFAVFALAVAWAMIRNPFQARVADAVVLSSVAFGCCLGGVWRAGSPARFGRGLVRIVILLVAAGTITMAARSGAFESPLRWLTTGSDAYAELTASPPLEFYIDRPARFTLRLAGYVRDCVPADDRLLLLWFEPEIYYYSERLMAQRHAVFAPAWAALQDEQRATLEKIARVKPPLVLARQSALDEYARATYPGVIDYVAREYALAATVRDGDEDYLIYARRDRPIVRTFGAERWPCFTRQSSRWARVGQPPE